MIDEQLSAGIPKRRRAATRRTTVDDLVARARVRIRRLEPADALAAQARGAVLVDTRCRDGRAADGSIPGARAIPLSVLLWRLDPDSSHRDPEVADLDREVILVCAHGFSSSLAAAQLVDLGYRSVGDVVGGFEAWRAAGLPVERA